MFVLPAKGSIEKHFISDLDIAVFVLTLLTEGWSCFPTLSMRAVRLLLLSEKIVWILRGEKFASKVCILGEKKLCKSNSANSRRKFASRNVFVFHLFLTRRRNSSAKTFFILIVCAVGYRDDERGLVFESRRRNRKVERKNTRYARIRGKKVEWSCRRRSRSEIFSTNRKKGRSRCRGRFISRLRSSGRCRCWRARLYICDISASLVRQASLFEYRLADGPFLKWTKWMGQFRSRDNSKMVDRSAETFA